LSEVFSISPFLLPVDSMQMHFSRHSILVCSQKWLAMIDKKMQKKVVIIPNKKIQPNLDLNQTWSKYESLIMLLYFWLHNENQV
jgi:hypothetical protein